MLREPTSPDQGQQNKRAREDRSRDHPQGPRGSGSAPRLPSWGCAGTAGCPAATPGGCPPAWLPMRATPRGWPTSGSSSVPEGHERAINPNLDSSSKADLETRRKYRELKRKLSKRALMQRKARAREEPSPGPPASETDARPPGHQPRGGAPARHGSAAAKRARPRKRANFARSKICTFGPELGFEQRNRFRSLRDTRRTEKKVLRKPPAARPVVGQTFKYIY